MGKLRTIRPRRLWVMAGVNVLITSFNIVAVLFLFFSPNVPAAFAKGPISVVSTSALSLVLMISSVYCAIGSRIARNVTIAAAVLFYGVILANHIAVLVDSGSEFPAPALLKLRAGVLRTLIELSITLWAVLSLKSRVYFATRPLPPN